MLCIASPFLWLKVTRNQLYGLGLAGGGTWALSSLSKFDNSVIWSRCKTERLPRKDGVKPLLKAAIALARLSICAVTVTVVPPEKLGVSGNKELTDCCMSTPNWPAFNAGKIAAICPACWAVSEVEKIGFPDGVWISTRVGCEPTGTTEEELVFGLVAANAGKAVPRHRTEASSELRIFFIGLKLVWLINVSMYHHQDA